MKTAIVIFGATGDLFTKKIGPSLLQLYKEKKVPEETSIIGFSRRDLNDETFRNHVKEKLDDSDCTTEFLKLFSFVSSPFDELDGYLKLYNKIKDCENILLHLSVQPSFYQTIVDNLIKSNVSKLQAKILVEKPIGFDLESSREVEETLNCCFSEEQIFRIDHYLHKRITKNIFSFRFYNTFFKNSWNNQAIKNITISTLEDFGVEDRGAFYETVGALRDVGQNHLLSFISILTMPEPKDFSPETIRAVRAEQMQKIIALDEYDIIQNTFRGQHEGYTNIENVDKNSKTETYFRIKAEIDDKNWRGVPIILEAGKKFKEQNKFISVNFYDSLKEKSESFEVDPIGNEIVFGIYPTQNITLDFYSAETDDETGNLQCSIHNVEKSKHYVDEYKRMFLDALRGDLTWFLTKEEVEAGWKFTDPIVNAWRENKVPLEKYKSNNNDILDTAKKKVDSENGNKTIGLIGLGKMGGNIARQLVRKDWEVIANNRSSEKIDEFVKEGGKGAYSLKELVNSLETPRIIWVMVPSGDAVENTLVGKDGLINLVEKGDYIIDAGNSNYKETIRRAKLFEKKGINFIDAGISGGPSGALNGACSMIGGSFENFKIIEPVFKAMSLPGGYRFFKGTGAGHFVKMVHNGIEYGMMQAIGEGFEVMKKSDFNLNMKHIAEVYGVGSVIESRLIDWLYKAFKEHTAELDRISGEVSHSGEGQWTVEAAKELGIPVKVIEDALQFRIDSEDNPSYTGKVVSALRNQFGGHSVSKE